MSKIISGKIKTIIFETNKMIIELEEGNKYYSEIKKGSIRCDILNELNNIVPLSYLEEGDLIKLNILENIQGLSKIKKIYINSKYQFMSDSSEDGYMTE
jgi:hypothetical protein